MKAITENAALAQQMQRMRHLHGHFIPRYATKRTYAGVVFEDKLYGHNYQTDRSFVTSFELRQEIKNQYIQALSRLAA
jgi:diadenosine tetraphosphate (Ap4A) HIT family hydrolase